MDKINRDIKEQISNTIQAFNNYWGIIFEWVIERRLERA